MNKPDSHSGLFCLLDHITILSCVKSLKSSRIQCLVWCVENGDSAFHSHESWCVAVECALIAIKKKKECDYLWGTHIYWSTLKMAPSWKNKHRKSKTENKNKQFVQSFVICIFVAVAVVEVDRL